MHLAGGRPRDEAPQLVVILTNSRELMRVVPAGTMPAEELKPSLGYETEPVSRRRVRCLTTYRWDGGERFGVFLREPEVEELAIYLKGWRGYFAFSENLNGAPTPRPMDKAAATLLCLEAVEDWAHMVGRTEKMGRGRQTGCANSR